MLDESHDVLSVCCNGHLLLTIDLLIGVNENWKMIGFTFCVNENWKLVVVVVV